ncbi:CRISPR-associated Cas3 family helicase [Plasticicumulans lactativorans]|uniref:CRISPR-associated Cas3 family helicase n=1 Tax=Plasticicumulans lactativorans TaxID=1133106 RepID=A0A4R2LAV7_9GAMM|nr:CRISPR-associated endonuclease Cas3'' [Plasticicumulans lactativorans]TCO81479.1 CRISPR-associated Cas3 family helicase [Plasticicumulans lactativorans]
MTAERTTPVALAHLAPDAETGWREHALDEHLREVGRLASQFAAAFDAADWGDLAGRWHDLGKYHPDFQRYIRAVNGADAHVETARDGGGPRKVDHSTAGALHAIDRFKGHGRVLAYLIAGHHCGLDNWHDGLAPRLANPEKRARLDATKAALADATVLDGAQPRSGVRGAREPGSFALWLRLLFSCLVDADFLDTEAFLQPHRAQARAGFPALGELLPAFDAFMADKQRRAGPSPVNAARAEVLAQCRAAAALPPGVFTLNVPTGGGKTLASMAFALEHARHHGQRRVVHVIPYTSIIEQTADVFRGIFADAVVEHHASAEVDTAHEDARSRLACENWDAPVIVTTTVQLFESLFAARPGRCRKLHNLIGSIVVLDEAQLLPVALLQPILDVLRLLTRHYGVTLVIATATQPALASQSWFGGRLRGLDAVQPIVPDPDALHRRLDRVRYEWPADFGVRRSWAEIADELAGHGAVLAIVNRRADAAALHGLLPHEGRVHLSALMCGAHRARVIADIRTRLAARRDGDATPLHVVSTQLVEAGVDVDFPVVYRALAGLDSIAQAAGRCNREGVAGHGRMVVFVPPQPAPRGLLRAAEQITVGQMHGRAPHTLAPADFGEFFGRLYRERPVDAQDICTMLQPDSQLGVRLRDAAEAFRLIDNEESGYRTIYVHYPPPAPGDDDGREIKKLLATLAKEGPERWLMRRLQRYAVSLPPWYFQQLLANGDLDQLRPDLYALRDGLYDADLGVPLSERPSDPGSLVL